MGQKPKATVFAAKTATNYQYHKKPLELHAIKLKASFNWDAQIVKLCAHAVKQISKFTAETSFILSHKAP